ncbi:hypothetical protein EKK58_08365 [Candidatus Dependentiae bacterium]|nr:MAG: hypothetical protein EKK58_08365 [Candidatus Dependentiae bacterium]
MSLERGITKSCPTCPKSKIKNYRSIRARWEQIVDRTSNPKAKAYNSYGGRGIYLSEEFKDVRVFAKYVSELEGYFKGAHLDRIDNDRGYERGNLRWVTSSQNNRNRRGLREIIFRDRKMCLQDFCELTGKSRTGVAAWFAKGFTAEQIYQLKKGEGLRYNRRTGQPEVYNTSWKNRP